MVIIRLARKGAKKKPFYHIMVTDNRRKLNGRGIERIGFYNPFATEDETCLKFSAERIEYWCSKGAKLSARVAGLIKQSATANPNTAT